jgi:Nif11 domain
VAVSQEAFERFRQQVLGDVVLQERLRAVPAPGDFVALLVRLGAEHGCDFSAAEVQQAMRDARRAWLARWI